MAETAGPVTLALGVPQRIELSAVADTLKRFDPPANARALRIAPDADVKIVIGGTDGAALGTTAYDPVYARTHTPFPVPGAAGGGARNLDSAAAASNSRRVCICGPASATFTITAVANLDDEANTANIATSIKADDSALAPGASFLPIGGIVDDTGTDTADEGDGVVARFTSRRAQLVTLDSDIRGENATTKRLDVSTPHSTAIMTTATTTTHLTGAGRYRGMRIGKSVAGAVITVYDNTAGSGTIVDRVTYPATRLNDTAAPKPCDVPVAVGITVVTSQATDVMIDWNANP